MYQYYLAQLDDNQQKLIRGMGNNLLSFATYEPHKEDWDKKFGSFWADKILVSDFDAYREISEKEAIQFIKVH
ncbi:hypothetical protein O3795_00085 [Haemophilus parahaemolyticus]|jgi:hypothetical protein|uniref:Uncharacterized protein n=4 Tax=Haemophilus TaxID=724 RepID=A0AAE6JWK8_HAEPH|nr:MULTISPECIES: hypothetical protein [Haemophilus]DAK42657.1 MAG TPA: hypothetical protein [Caudoviricetes sp.]EIJ72977.1 hypothetical protein HMPREF1050_0023 [Haemophilus parahaemolyticus HK385]KAA5523594.1 hypothetical protein F2S80_02375 [Haemophilus seminalis]MBS6047287.1 hypothetical protein [Haemophilus haemolyticus]MDK7281474.1 hypothetical protein [Haemophilus seminalis]